MFLKLLVLLVPRDIEVTHKGGVKAMSDEQIERAIEVIEDMLARRDAGEKAKVIEGRDVGADVGKDAEAHPPTSLPAHCHLPPITDEQQALQRACALFPVLPLSDWRGELSNRCCATASGLRRAGVGSRREKKKFARALRLLMVLAPVVS